MKITALTAFLTGLLFLIFGWYIPTGIAWGIAVIFILGSAADDNNWHRH
jgi:hypothetical protein